MSQSLGNELLSEIKAIWQIDHHSVQEFDNGFHWWPGHHKVTATCTPTNDPSDPEAWRLSVSTEFLTGVDLDNPKLTALIARMGSFSPSYGWTYTPTKFLQQHGLPLDGAIAFWSSTYVGPQTSSWLPAFFARMAIMQPIDAQRMAVSVAEMLGGRANISGSRFDGGTSDNDDILNVARDIFVPVGQQPSKWAGSTEFESIAERYGGGTMSFGTGGPDGLTLETPFGGSSSLIRLQHDKKNTALGSGLLGTIQLPVFESIEASAMTCMWLNFFCSRCWTGVPVHGTWHPREIQKGQFSPSYGTFVPNALYADGLATNVALWSLGLARWARLTIWPQLEDKTMAEILADRFGPIDSITRD